MAEEKNDCQLEDNCSTGTCAPVSPFSKEGLYFLAFILILFIILILILFFNGYL